MTRLKKSISFMAIALLTLNSVAGASVEMNSLDASGTLLTLNEAVERTLDSHAEVKRAMERLLKEEALYKGKRAGFFPKIGAETFSALATGDQHFLTYFDASVEQPLFQGGKIVAEKRKQEVRVESEKLKLDQAKQNLELSVRILYAEVLKEKELTRIAQGEVKELTQGYERIKAIFDKELIPRYELFRAETLLQKAKQALVRHKETYDYLLTVLKETIGINEEESIDLEPLDQIEELAPDVSAYLEAFRKNDPVYKLKELEVKEKGFEKRILQADRFPHISLAARWNLNRDVYVNADRFMVGIVGKWDIWDFGRLGSEIKAKSHEMEEAKWAGVIEIQEKEKEIQKLFHEAKAMKEKIRLQEALIQEREEAYKNEKANLVAGEKGTGELLDSFLALEEAKMQKLEAVSEYRVLLVRLQSHIKFGNVKESEI